MKMRDKDGLRAKECPDRGDLRFPPISPVVIVLMERGDRCLLAGSPRFKDGFYSVLAGFCVHGKSLVRPIPFVPGA